MSIQSIPAGNVAVSVVTNIVSVDSTTQQALFTSVGDDIVVVISNKSNNRPLWVKPDDNTTTKQGILVKPGDHLVFPTKSELTIFGIMDAGGAVDIAIVEFS